MALTELSRAWRGGGHSTAAPRGALLLCHGFTGSPQSMRPWGLHHAERGWEVSIPLLPGHGTTWQDLARTTHDQWLEALRIEARDLAARHGSLSVGALSMGGSLALALATDDEIGPAVDALVLVNPSVVLTRAQALAAPVLQHLLPSVAAIGSDVRSGAQEEAYSRTPVRGVEQMRRLQRGVRRSLPAVRCPMLLATSPEDHVVDPRSSDLIAARVGGRVERLALTRSYHVATLDHDAPLLFERSAEFLDRVRPR